MSVYFISGHGLQVTSQTRRQEHAGESAGARNRPERTKEWSRETMRALHGGVDMHTHTENILFFSLAFYRELFFFLYTNRIQILP